MDIKVCRSVLYWYTKVTHICFSAKTYFLSKHNGVCSDYKGEIPAFSTSEECRLNVPKIGRHFWTKAYTTANYSSAYQPKGCFVTKKYRIVYWNGHATGSPNGNARQVCTKETGVWYRRSLLITKVYYTGIKEY